MKSDARRTNLILRRFTQILLRFRFLKAPSHQLYALLQKFLSVFRILIGKEQVLHPVGKQCFSGQKTGTNGLLRLLFRFLHLLIRLGKLRQCAICLRKTPV